MQDNPVLPDHFNVPVTGLWKTRPALIFLSLRLCAFALNSGQFNAKKLPTVGCGDIKAALSSPQMDNFGLPIRR
jgi:hypothetical protein